jgi:hypothetical protein
MFGLPIVCSVLPDIHDAIVGACSLIRTLPDMILESMTNPVRGYFDNVK